MSRKRIAIFILVLAALVGTGVPMGAVCAFAPYVPQEVEGEISHISVLEQTPIIFEYEKFYFDMSSVDSGTLTATYEMYNPESEAVEISCALPVKDGDNGVSVTADGVSVDTELRRVYCVKYYNTDYIGDYRYTAPIMEDDFIENYFLSPDLPVTKYAYKVTELSGNYGTVSVNLTKGSLDTRFIFEQEGMFSYSAYWVTNSVDCDVGDDLVFYVLGDGLIEEPQFSFRRSGEAIDGEVQLIEKQEMSFLDFTLSSRDENVTTVDWYNAMATRINELWSDIFYTAHLDISNSLQDWIKYSITIDGGERVTNVVTMPMFPKYIYEDYTKPAYEYHLNLLCTQNLNISRTKFIISSPYNVINAYYFEYDKGEDAYVYITDQKTEYGKISFMLSKASSLKMKWSAVDTFFLIIALLPLIPIIIVVIVVIFVVRAIVKKKRNKNSD